MSASNNHSQQSQSEQHTIGDILNQLEHWRSNKANPNESIPDPIWQSLFTLEQQFSPSRLQKIFSLSAKQYQTKRDELNSHAHTQTHNQAPSKSSDQAPPIQNTPFAELKVKPVFPKNPLCDHQTIIVEFQRQDGHVMKIHTLTTSFHHLINAFFANEEDSVC